MTRPGTVGCDHDRGACHLDVPSKSLLYPCLAVLPPAVLGYRQRSLWPQGGLMGAAPDTIDFYARLWINDLQGRDA